MTAMPTGSRNICSFPALTVSVLAARVCHWGEGFRYGCDSWTIQDSGQTPTRFPREHIPHHTTMKLSESIHAE